MNHSDYDKMRGSRRPVHEGDPFSLRHPRMSLQNRAKIFMPFAALKGFEEAIGERQVLTLTCSPCELSDDEKDLLDRKLRFLTRRWRENRSLSSDAGRSSPIMLTVVYFERNPAAEADEGGIRGTYLLHTGPLTRIDETAGILEIGDKRLHSSDIFTLEGELFDAFEES